MDVNVHGEVKLKLELPDALMKLLERCVMPEVKVSVPEQAAPEQAAPVKDAPAKKAPANAVPDTLPEPTVEVKPVTPAKATPVQTGIAPVAAPQESNLSCDDLRKHIAEARKLARAHGNDILSNPEIKAKMAELGAAKMTDLTAAQVAEMFSNA
ncbi:MAG: hypothetical protein Q4Q51_03695 [Eubacteriales bacterium]|nr:hypothetical protein [Eubacteriales bacterium]